MTGALTSCNSNIVIADINLTLAKKTTKELEKNKIKAIAVEMDVRNENQINKMIKSAI